MTLALGQVSVGSLVLGKGTPYRLIDFNPWTRTARADQGGPRAWNHGSWSGAEFQDQATVPMGIITSGAINDVASWQAAHQQLAAAFAASDSDVELRWNLDGAEYLMLGRPRMVDPDITNIGLGFAVTRAAFVGLSPLIYSGVLHAETLVLPTTSGGLMLPLTLPLTIAATVVTGTKTLVNAGTAPAGLILRIDGPVSQPRVSMTAADGTVLTLRFGVDLTAGQWLDVDTAARTVYINGTASRRGDTYGDWPILAPGAGGELVFDAATYQASARLTVSYRDGWY